MTYGKHFFRTLLCVFIILANTGGTELLSQMKFREFSRDKDIFERYTDEADKSATAEEWQRVVDSGRAEMTALWERNALAECDRYIQEGYDAGEARTVMEEARADWENEFDSAMLFERGQWRASQGAIGYTAGNMDGLQERVADAGNAGLADVEAWNNYVAGELQATENSWESTYAPQIEMLYGQAESLTGIEREGFLAEAERIEKDLRTRFDVEKDTILYLGKNGFIEQIVSRNRTLREESESKSAAVITDNIISDTQSQIRAEEEKILDKAYSPESGSTIDFSGLGENWQEDLKKLIDYGMSKWEAARQRLYNDIISWKKTAEEAFETAEAKWRQGLIKLETARREWERKLTREIYAGLDAWEDGNEELNRNIEQSRAEFAGYMESMGAQWSDSNRDLVDMAVNGSAVYADAVDNIKWLTEMRDKTAAQYAFSGYDDDFKAAIGADLVNQVDAAVTAARSMFIQQHMYEPEFSQRLEVVVTQAGKPGYKDDAGTFTETYKISVIEYISQRITPSGEFSFGPYTRETKRTAWTRNWNNVVTLESDPVLRTANCYYAFELARWQRIRESFSTIASDAEFYMHERNMEGADSGAGYLTNAQGNYGTNADGSADPYLMTQAEYSLELAERDMAFWNQRLDIARSVLEYAEGNSRETAADTERNMSEAKTTMDNAKAAYDAALTAVNNILAELRNIQGLKPLTDDPDAWQNYNDSYNTSIENLAKVYSDAETALKTAEENYSKAKAAFIVYKNMTAEDGGVRPVEYIKNEITEIERNVVRAEQASELQREELFKRQNEADFTSRTSGFAGLYGETVKQYEGAKGRVELFRSIITGAESEADVNAWAAAISTNRQALWGDAADEYYAVLEAAVSAYNSASDADRAAMRDNVLLEIRQIYLSLNADVDIYRKSIEMLRDEHFDPETFADTEYTVDHDVYADYARYSAAAMDIIEQYFEDHNEPGADQSYEGAWGFLKAEFDRQRFVYGADNSSYIIHYTALKYFEERYKGLTADTWGQYRQRLAAESDYADNAVNLHENMAGGVNAGTLAEMERLASEGAIRAVQYLREYYAAGSAIPGLDYIREYDARADIADYVNESLKSFAIENSSFFITKETLQGDHNYLDDLYGFIRSAVTLGSVPGENVFSVEAFRDMTPEEISSAAQMLQQYVANLEMSGMPVPESIRTAAAAIAEVKKDLDTKLFILSYMNNMLTGTAEEILAAAGDAADAAETAYAFLQTCSDSIEYGTSYNDIAMRIISTYESLSESQKLEIDGNETSDVNRVSTFINNLYSHFYTIDLAEREGQYMMNIGDASPSEYATLLPLNMRQQFINDTTPAYERAQYDLALSEGRVTSVDAYITTRTESGGLDDETAQSLRNYALIKEYLGAAVRRPFGEQSFEVQVYLAEKFYYDTVFSGNAGARDIESLLEEKFGRANINNEIVDRVEQYAGRLNAVLFYNGKTDSYIKALSPDAALYFQMYIYGEGSAILPGYEYGIYGRASVANGKLAIAEGGLEREIDRFDAGFGARIIAMEEYAGRARSELDKARALDTFVKTGVQEKSWRDNAVSVIDTEKVMGEDDVITTNSTTVIEARPVSESGYMDSYDEEGVKNVIMYSQNPVERDTLNYSINGIIDDVNKIASIFGTLGKSYETAAPAVNTITAFLYKADRAYDYLTGYIGTDGEAVFASCIDGASGANIAARAEVDDLYSGLMSMESAIVSDKQKVVSNNEIIEQLGDKDEAALLAEIEAAQRVHQQMESAYQAAKSDIDDAQERYRLANERYTDAMEHISETYNQYKTAEVEYERRYSIYEYANTPYLKESSSLDSGLGSATTVDGSGNTDYSELPVPDARENYERILARYNEAEAVYRARQSAVDGQETVEELNTNTDGTGEYADYKSDFVRKSESYIRICQADTVLNETVAGYKVDYEQKEAEYKQAKDSIQFFVDLSEEVKENKERMAELSEIRDKILSHIKTGTDVTLYSDAMAWYGCWEVMQREGDERPSGDDAAAMNVYAEKFESLALFVQQDMKDLYANFGDGATLKGIRDNFKRYAKARYMKDYYEHKKNHTSLVKHPKRWYRYYKREKEWRDKREDAKNDYIPHANNIRNTLNDFVDAKTDYIPAYTKYVNAVSVKTLEDVKRYLGTEGGYNLTDEDLRYLYDTTTPRVDVEGINVGTIRKDLQRKDIDGANVKVRYYEVQENGETRGKVVVLNKDGSDSTETYNVTDAWIKVRLNGEEPEILKTDAVYDLYDNNYDITVVSGRLRVATSDYRAGYMTDLMGYVQDSAQAGTHDYTVMLRDLEDTYNGLKDTAVGFNSTTEIRQRSFEGYNTVMSEYAWNENGSSVQQMIMNEYIRQNRMYQEQLWQQQQEKYEQRRSRWEEVTGYILNRGMRDWRLKGNDYLQKWRKWSIEAQKEIEAGKQWWTDRDLEMKQEMKTWGDDAGKAANKEAAQKIYADLETTVDGYEKQIRKNMPGVDGITVDTDSILSDTMKDMPIGTLGVLNNSMFNTDRVAGMAEIFGFGNNAALVAKNREWQAEYEEAFGVMRNLQVLDVLNGIIEGFNRQLVQANKSVYRSVENDLRYSDTFGEADFVRNENENLWTIRVCVESNLTGDKYKTRKFRDYVNMVNSTVMLKPIKGLDGEIDFTKPETFANIDASELDVYVGLESSKLNDEIENVFEAGGLFSEYTDSEFERLNKEFGKYYVQWQAGEAMLDAGFYAKPMFPGGPNMMTTAAIAASFTGSPWAMLAVSALSTGISIADGTVSWQQAGVQMGVGALKSSTGYLSPLVDMAASGITYDEDGGVGWDKKQFKQGIKTSVIRAGVQFVTGSGVATDVIMSGVKVGGSWTDIGFDNKHWGEHLMTGVASGISQGVGAATGNAMLGSMVQQGLLTAAYNMSGGKGFKNDYSQYNWNAMAPSAETFGSQLGNMFSSYMTERYSRKEDGKSVPYESGRSDPLGFIDDMLGAAYYGMQKVKEFAGDIGKSVSGFTGLDHVQGLGLGLDQAFSDMGGAAAYRAMNAGSSVWGGLTSFTEKAGNWLGGDGFVDNATRNANLMAEYRNLYNNPVLIAQNGSGDRMSDTGDDDRAMRDAIRMTEDREHRMQEIEGKLGVSEQELSARINAENVSMMPDAAQLNNDIAGSWKNSTAKEVNAKLDVLRRIDPEAARRWDAYFKGIRDSESKQVQISDNGSVIVPGLFNITGMPNFDMSLNLGYQNPGTNPIPNYFDMNAISDFNNAVNSGYVDSEKNVLLNYFDMEAIYRANSAITLAGMNYDSSVPPAGYGDMSGMFDLNNSIVSEYMKSDVNDYNKPIGSSQSTGWWDTAKGAFSSAWNSLTSWGSDGVSNDKLYQDNGAISPTSGTDGTVAIWAIQPSYLNDKAHNGIDLGAPGGKNSPSFSIIEGTIEDIFDSKEKDGKNINYVTVIDKDGNLVTSKHITPNPTLQKGDHVYPGDVLGTHDLSGKAAGKTTGYHTHLEVKNSNNIRMDAFQYLLNKQPNLVWQIHPKLETKFKNTYSKEYNIINKKRWY